MTRLEEDFQTALFSGIMARGVEVATGPVPNYRAGLVYVQTTLEKLLPDKYLELTEGEGPLPTGHSARTRKPKAEPTP